MQSIMIKTSSEIHVHGTGAYCYAKALAHRDHHRALALLPPRIRPLCFLSEHSLFRSSPETPRPIASSALQGAGQGPAELSVNMVKFRSPFR